MSNARKRLTAQQLESIALIVSKDYNGMTMQEIADKVGVSRNGLYLWQKNRLYNDELIKQTEELQRAFLAEAYSQVRAMVKSPTVADNNKLKAIELVLRNQGRLKDVQETTVSVEEKSLDDILAEIEED